MAQELDEDAMKSLLKWIDSIPLSRPKKNFARDFSDGVLAAEVISHYFPRLVELHNYQTANSRDKKLINWATLNRKVLSKFGFTIPREIIEDIIASKQKATELFLFGLRRVIEDKLQNKNQSEEFSNTDQYYDVGPPHEYQPQQSHHAPKPPKFRNVPGQKKRPQADSHALSETLSLTVRAGLPLSELNLALLDTDTKLILAEKEMALLASHETIKILQLKVNRLEQLLQLKDKRITELKRQVELNLDNA